MSRSSHVRMAIGTAAVVAIALSLASLKRSWDDVDAARAVRVVVRRQLDAFNRNDYPAAYRFAAPEIQERFPLPEFKRMVKEGYPQIARSRSAVFGTPEVRGPHASVPLTVTGEDGVTLRVIYMLQRERNGWRVAGVDDGGPPHAPSPAPEKRPRSDAEPI